MKCDYFPLNGGSDVQCNTNEKVVKILQNPGVKQNCSFKILSRDQNKIHQSAKGRIDVFDTETRRSHKKSTPYHVKT